MEFAPNYKIVTIAILARDCEETLPRLFRKIERLRSFFDNSQVIIVENNSKDATKQLLEEYSSSHSFVMLFMVDDPAMDALPRIEKMAVLRNRCLEIVRESGYDPDLYIAIDGDLDFNASSVLRAIQHAPHDWAGLFANGRYYLQAGPLRIPVLYYDLFAYLPEGNHTIEGDSLTEEEMHRIRPITHKALRKNHYLRCRSAFGGVGIYKYEAIGENCYTVEKNTVSSNFEHLCEHIPFNRGVLKNGALYICRDLKVFYEPISIKTWLYCLAADNNRQSDLRKMIGLYRTLFVRNKATDGGSK